MEAKCLEEEVAFSYPHTGALWPKGSPAPVGFAPPMPVCLSPLILGAYFPSLDLVCTDFIANFLRGIPDLS